MPIVMEAVRVELKKLGRPAAEAELSLPRDRERGR